MTLLLAREAIHLQRRLLLAAGTLGVGSALEGEVCRFQLGPGTLGRVGQLIDDTAARLLRGVQPSELALQRVERLDGSGIALLGDPRLVLAFGKAKANVRDRFLMMPTRFARGKKARAVLPIERFELADGLGGGGTLVVGRLLARDGFP